MADPVLELLFSGDNNTNSEHFMTAGASSGLEKYLTRLLSLRPSDLNTTETQSLAQNSQSNLIALQALSSRSHRSSTTSSDHLSTLQQALPNLTRTVNEVKSNIPQLDENAVKFATTYSRAWTSDSQTGSEALNQRKEFMLFSRQSEKLQDIIELPSLLSTAIASAASGPSGSANYSQALDLYAHIKRLDILYPDSRLVADVQVKAEQALKEMTANLLNNLRGQNIRLPVVIRTIGWLRRVVPELGSKSITKPPSSTQIGQSGIGSYSLREEEQAEGSFGALYLAARLSTFLSLTEDALAPLRDLADQETEKRLHGQKNGTSQPQLLRRASAHGSTHASQGQQTERYLKRYIEIFREQSFQTIQMYRNVFPSSTDSSSAKKEDDILQLPSALSSFPMHLVNLLIETLQTYLPNVTDSAARESLLVQVLYASNSLGRLGADFSMMISLLDLPEPEIKTINEDEESAHSREQTEPEWYKVIQKHRIQSARLDAMAAGQESAARRASQDVTVK